MTVNLDIAPFVRVRFAVYVHAVSFSFLQPYAVDTQRRRVAVIDLHLRGCTSLRREDRVETQRVARERQTQVRVVTRVILAAAYERAHTYYKKEYLTHLFEIEGQTYAMSRHT